MTICDPCKTAGDFVPDLRRAGKDHVRRMWVKVLHDHHSQCKGSSWCDCQHKIPEETENDA